MRLSISHLQQLGFIKKNEADFELCIKLLSQQAKNPYLSRERRKKYIEVLQQLNTYCRFVNRIIMGTLSLNAGVFELSTLQKLLAPVEPLIYQRLLKYQAVTDPNYILSVRELFPTPEIVAHQRHAYTKIMAYAALLIKIQTLNAIREDGKNLEAVIALYQDEITNNHKIGTDLAFTKGPFASSYQYFHQNHLFSHSSDDTKTFEPYASNIVTEPRLG